MFPFQKIRVPSHGTNDKKSSRCLPKLVYLLWQLYPMRPFPIRTNPLGCGNVEVDKVTLNVLICSPLVKI
jgi:hypothetical protein